MLLDFVNCVPCYPIIFEKQIKLFRNQIDIKIIL